MDAYKLIVVGMGGTEFALLNPEADARLREGIARDPDAPAEYVAAHDAAEAVKRGGGS